MTLNNNIDEIKPVRFPTRWMTYKQRIRRDLDRAYASDEGEDFFNDDYLARLHAEAKQLDERLIKLFALQLAISGFLIVGFFANEASISLFSITLKQATGVKELLLALYCFIAVMTWIISVSRETTLTIVERLMELSATEPLSNFGKIAAPTAFSCKIYAPRQYEDWIFPTRANKLLFVAFFGTAISLAVTIFALSFVVTGIFIADVYRHPTLGIWSKLILAYAIATALFGILLIVRFYIPLPYRDQSILLELNALENVDTALHIQKRAEIFGAESKFRRYTWKHSTKLALTRVRTSLSSVKTALLSRFQSWLRRRRMRRNWP